MRKLHLFTLVVLALMLAAMPAAAQDGTFGLDDDDFALFLGVNGDSATQTQYTFDYDVNFDLSGDQVPPVAIALGGTGILDIPNEQINFSIDGTVDVAGEAIPLSAELRLLSEQLYGQAVNPDTGEATGWFSINADEVVDGIDTDAVSDVALESFADGAGVSSDDFNPGALLLALDDLSSIDPQDFIGISRDGDAFATSIDLNTIAADPSVADALVQVLVASGIESDANDEIVMGMTFVMDQVATSLEDATFTLDQQINPATQLVQGANLTLELPLDLSMLDAGALDMGLTIDVDLSSFGEPAGLQEPENVTNIPASFFVQAFNDAMGEEQAALVPEQTVPETNDPADAALDGDSIAVGETVAVTVPAGEAVNLALETDQTVTITARATDGQADTVLTLLDSSGTELVSNDDHSTGLAELGTFDSAITSFSVPGTVTIQVTEFGDDAGDIEVSVVEAEAIANPDSIAVGETLTVTVPMGAPLPLNLNTTDTVTITARALDSSDTVLTVLDASGAELPYNDDHNTTMTELGVLDSAVTDLTIPGSAVIQVSELGGDMGEIEVSVMGEGGTASSTTMSTGTVSLGEVACTAQARNFEEQGADFTATCPAGCAGAATVWGTDTYTDDSSVCGAAIHAGAITDAGGSVSFTLTDGMDEYVGSERNGVSTNNWGAWDGSFVFGN